MGSQLADDLLFPVAAVIEQHLEETTGFLGSGNHVARRNRFGEKSVVVDEIAVRFDIQTEELAEIGAEWLRHPGAGKPVARHQVEFLARGAIVEMAELHRLLEIVMPVAADRTPGHALEDGLQDGSTGDRMVGLLATMNIRRLGFADQLEQGPVPNQFLKRDFALDTGNATAMRQDLQDVQPVLAVPGEFGNVMGDRVEQVDVAVVGQLVDQDGGYRLARRVQAGRRSGADRFRDFRAPGFAEAAGKTDCPVQHDLAVTADAEHQCRVVAGAVEVLGAGPDRADIVQRQSGRLRSEFANPVDIGHRLEVGGNRQSAQDALADARIGRPAVNSTLSHSPAE